jgi:hypothetical protein
MPALLPAAGLLPVPLPKRKWEDQANGGVPGESSGRKQPQKSEARAAKQVKVEETGVDPKVLKTAFLKMVKLMNENEADKKNYWANGKLSQLKCPVCQRYAEKSESPVGLVLCLDVLIECTIKKIKMFKLDVHA